jgi:hypothetical protein
MQKVVGHLQSCFSTHDWYFLRKIHKKESNYFLNKGGKRGSAGAGWLSHHTKSSRSSNCAEEEIKFNAQTGSRSNMGASDTNRNK